MMYVLKIKAKGKRQVGGIHNMTMELNQTNSFWCGIANHQVFQIVQKAPSHYGVVTAFIHFYLTRTPSHRI